MSGQGQQHVYGMHSMGDPSPCFISPQERYWVTIQNGIALVSPPLALHRESPNCRMKAPAPARAKKRRRLYQVRVVIHPITVPILIQVQQNTLNGLFLNTAWTKCVKTRLKDI